MPMHPLYYQPPSQTTNYLPLKRDGLNMYSSLMHRNGTSYDAIKDVAWDPLRNIQPAHQGFYIPYDHTMAPYSYSSTGYNPIGYDVARRKNATKEATNTLKAWLYEHRKNPYPTKGEKIMLAIITKMTMTQISTWFANARRRLKKENKMTWSPKCRSDDEDSDTEVNKSECDTTNETKNLQSPHSQSDKSGENLKASTSLKSMHHSPSESNSCETLSVSIPHESNESTMNILQVDDISPATSPVITSSSSNTHTSSHNIVSIDKQLKQTVTKPKIWSVTEMLEEYRPPLSESLAPTDSDILNKSPISTQNNVTSSSTQDTATSRCQSQLYTAHASQILQGHGIAVLSGNGGATHTWNPLTMSQQIYSKNNPSPITIPSTFANWASHTKH